MYSQHLAWPDTPAHSSPCCLLRQALLRCVSSRDGALAGDIHKAPKCSVCLKRYLEGSFCTAQRCYCNLRLSCLFLLVFPLTLVGIYFNPLNSFSLFGA